MPNDDLAVVMTRLFLEHLKRRGRPASYPYERPNPDDDLIAELSQALERAMRSASQD